MLIEGMDSATKVNRW